MHLSTEDLARLLDEPPGPAEAEHLRDCLVCRREMAELRALTDELADLPDPEPSPGAWRELEARLLEEGLIREPAPRVAAWYERPALRIAAALALFLLGGGAGIALWEGRGGTEVANTPPPPRRETPAPSPSAEPVDRLPTERLAADEPLTDQPEPAPEVGGGTTRFASAESPAPARRRAEGRRSAPAPRPAEVAAAERELDQAEAAYLSALQRYAAMAAPESGADPLTRLAALERLVEVTRDALDRTPDDPVLNGYHLAALGERDELKKRIARASQAQWF